MKTIPKDFWEQSDYAMQTYEGEPLNDDLVSAVENSLGYKLPRSYVELMRTQNGGIPLRTCFRTNQRTSWATDHIAITGIYGIGFSKASTLCGQFRTAFWVDEWGYPPLGIYFADCPSAGHDMICLDYFAVGPDGEPRVVHVDQELDYRVTVLAETFEQFILGLETEENFPVE